MPDRVITSIESDIATVALNRPDKHNGLDMPMLHELIQTGEKLKKNRQVRAVILKGNGPSFSAGLDFASAAKKPVGIAGAFLKNPLKERNAFQQMCWVWRELPVPVIAVVQGNCFGGGLQIALAADFRLSARDARYSVMEIKWGLIPDLTGTKTLAEILPMDKVKELAMTGRIVDADEALTLGLVTRVCDDPVGEAQAMAELFRGKSPDGLAGIKRVIQDNWNVDDDKALARERRIQAKILMGKNQRIAMQANFKKAQPEFKKRMNWD